MVKPGRAGISPAKLMEVDGIVEDLVAKHRLSGATVAIARGGKVVHLRAYGKSNLETGAPMREDTIFRIYSMSKAITTAAAMVLVDEGKIRLDDPVSKYIPEFKGVQLWDASGNHPPKREPSVRDLMRHTAGFTYGGSGIPAVDKLYREADLFGADKDLQGMCAALAKIPLTYEPGTRWVYSVSVDVLGRVIEVASGQPFDAFLEARIFRPLDMKDTGFYVPLEKVSRFAACYNSDGHGMLTLQDAPEKSAYLKKPKLLSGGGGLVSTTRDYLRFLCMVAGGGKLQGKQILKPSAVALMTHNDLAPEVMPISFGAEKRHGLGFGLGFNVRSEYSDKWDAAAPVGEYGWGGMASTHYWVSPKDDLVVVTMEQTLPYSFMLEWAVKGPIYEAARKK